MPLTKWSFKNTNLSRLFPVYNLRMESESLFWLERLCVIWPVLPEVSNFILFFFFQLHSLCYSPLHFPKHQPQLSSLPLNLPYSFIFSCWTFFQEIPFSFYLLLALHQSSSLSLNITSLEKFSLILFASGMFRVPVWCFQTWFANGNCSKSDSLLDYRTGIVSILFTCASSVPNIGT